MRPAIELGLTETRCLDYPDGGLSEIDSQILVRLASELLSEFDPDVVITFGPDGFSGHPDHIAVGAAVTAACYEMRSAKSIRLFHCHLPRSRMLLRDRLAEWVVELATRFKGTKDFVRALSVFSRETTALGYAADFVNVEWFPSGSYLIEQGEAATMMYFLLSGQVEIRREGEDGRVRVVDRSGPGEFIGEEGIATGQPRNAHVVAVDDVTSLTFSAAEPVPHRRTCGAGPASPDQIASVRGSDRRQSEHVHRRLRLRRPQDPSHGRTSLSVSDRSEHVPRSNPPRDVRRRVLHPGLAGAGAPHFAPRRVGQSTPRRRVRERARAPLPRRRTTQLRSTAPYGRAEPCPRGARGQGGRQAAALRRC